MDKDVQGKMNRLCDEYLKAQARATNLRFSKLPTGRARSRAEAKLVNVLGELRDRRMPISSALVRLAYVRGLRSVRPEARLDSEHEIEVKDLERQLDRALGGLEASTLRNFRGHVRRMVIAEAMRRRDCPPESLALLEIGDEPFPLEQRARASASSIVDMASVAGAMAGAVSSSYDEERND